MGLLIRMHIVFTTMDARMHVCTFDMYISTLEFAIHMEVSLLDMLGRMGY